MSRFNINMGNFGQECAISNTNHAQNNKIHNESSELELQGNNSHVEGEGGEIEIGGENGGENSRQIGGEIEIGGENGGENSRQIGGENGGEADVTNVGFIKEIEPRFLSQDGQVLTQKIFYDGCPCCTRECMLIPVALILIVEVVITVVLYASEISPFANFAIVAGIGLYFTFIVTFFLAVGKILDIVADKKANTITFSTKLTRGDTVVVSKPLSDLIDLRVKDVWARATKRSYRVVGHCIMYLFKDYSVIEVPFPQTYVHQVFLEQMALFNFEDGKAPGTTSYGDTQVQKIVGWGLTCKLYGQHCLANFVFIGVVNLIVALAQPSNDEDAHFKEFLRNYHD